MKNKKIIIAVVIAIVIIMIIAWYYLIYKPSKTIFEGAACKIGILPGIIKNDVCVALPLTQVTTTLIPR